MKKSFFFLFLFLPLHLWSLTTEVKMGYFYPQSSTFRDIFGNGGFDVGFELREHICDTLHGFIGMNYFGDSGTSLGGEQRTRIRIVPVSAGLLWQRSWYCFDPYFGLGPTLTFFVNHNESNFVDRHVKKTRWGGVLKIGTVAHLYDALIGDLFLEYHYCKIISQNGTLEIQHHNLQVGGIRVGVGLGWAF